MPRFVRGGRGLWRKIQSLHGEGYSPNTSVWIALIVIFFILAIAIISFIPLLPLLELLWRQYSARCC